MIGHEEKELLAGVLAGDAGALDGLLARAYPVLVLLAGGPEADARRLVEDACREVFAQRVEGEPPEDLRLRLRAAVLQRAQATGPSVAAEASPVAAVSPACFDPPGTPWAGWWTDEEARKSAGPASAGRSIEAGPEIAGALVAALRAVPLGERAVTVLRDVEGWSPADVEELLGLTPRRQRSRLHAARAQLRTAVERAVTGERTDLPPPHAPAASPPDYDFSCQDLVESTTEFLDGAHTPRERAFLEQHLLVCPSCLAHLRQVEATLALVRTLPDVVGPPPAGVRDAVLAAYRGAR